MNAAGPAAIFEPITATDLDDKKVRHFVHTQMIWNFFNSLGICNFAAAPYSALTLPMIDDLLGAVTGWNTSLFEIMELGERTITMARILNNRLGLTAKDDYLPERLYEKLEAGTPREKKLNREEVQEALRLYYEAMGWDDDGVPPTAV